MVPQVKGSFDMVLINKRKISVCILLSIITFGIYLIYWMYLLVDNTKTIKKDESGCVGEMLCLIFIPFYFLYWWFTRGKIVKDKFAEHGYSAMGNEIAYLILGILGLGIISMAIMQDDFNSLPYKSTEFDRRSTINKKYYKSVLDRVEEYRYKKGIVRLNVNSSVYTVGKVLYILSFAWMVFFQLVYILGALLLASNDSLANNATQLLIALGVLTPILAIGLVLLCLKKHVASLIVTVLAALLTMAQLYQNEQVQFGFMEGVFTSVFFWRHFAPGILLIIFAALVCGIGIKTAVDLKKDYKKVMESMFINYKEKNPSATDAQWQAYLAAGAEEQPDTEENNDANP